MIRLLLVDDDFLARNAVHQLLGQCEQLGIELLEACDGQEAILRLQAGATPDLVLIDVSMPGMDGLALLDWIHAHHPQLPCAMLSSYSDFEYVREALTKGAFDYLLKHQLTADGLLGLFEHAGIRVESAAAVRGPAQSLESYLSTDGAAPLDWQAPEGLAFCIGALPTTGPHDGAHARSVLQTCRHMLAETQIVACLPRMPLMLLASRDGEGALAALESKQRALNDTVTRYHNTRISWEPPRRCPSVDILREHYLAAQQSCVGAPASGSASTTALAFENALTTAVLHNHQKTIRKLIDERFEQAAAAGHPRAPESELVALLQKCRAQLLHTENAAMPPAFPADPLRKTLADSFSALAAQHQQLAFSGFQEVIRNTFAFLHDHMAEDIHLSDVAAYCNINYSYLSYLFKKETGIGVTQYLNALRVQQCMRLMMLQNVPVTRVYEGIGFKNHSHFYSVFKSVTGVPPAQFKRSPNAIQYLIRFSPLKPTEFLPEHE